MAERGPKIVEWGAAAGVIRLLLVERRGYSAVAVVGITGPPGAGKSTLARAMSACVVATDDYLPDYDGLPEHERDLPERADLSRLAADLASLRAGRGVSVPVWSFHTHRREGERAVAPAEVVAVEGLHALHQSVLHTVDVRVFVEAPAAVRWNRVEMRERAGERGWGVEVARAFFENVAEPTFARYAAGYRGSADVVVVNDRG